MVFEIKERSKVDADIYGTKVALSRPTIRQIEQLQKDMSDAEASTRVTRMKEFGVGLGLTPEMCDSMEMDHFIQLIEHLTGQSKKK
jgi:hypothetical protein